jgi:hypothetical protein
MTEDAAASVHSLTPVAEISLDHFGCWSLESYPTHYFPSHHVRMAAPTMVVKKHTAISEGMLLLALLALSEDAPPEAAGDALDAPDVGEPLAHLPSLMNALVYVWLFQFAALVLL